MALPHDQTSFEDLLDEMLWTGTILLFTPGYEKEGQKILDTRTQIIAMLGARNTKRDARVQASVAHYLAWERVRTPLESFERQVDAHFDADRAGYGKVFENTVPALMRTPESSRAEAFKPVVEFASKPHQGKLGTTAKAFLAAWNEYAATATKLKDADEVLDVAIDTVGTMRHSGVVVMLQADALLRREMPDDAAARKKFFRSKGGGKVDLEAEARKAEERAEKAIAEAKEARARADKAKAEAEAKAKAEAEKKAKAASRKKGKGRATPADGESETEA